MFGINFAFIFNNWTTSNPFKTNHLFIFKEFPMKNIIILLACLMLASMAFAGPADIERLHKIAQKANGFQVERDGQFMFVPVGQNLASLYLGSEMGTGYMKDGEKNVYWEIIPIEGGVKIIIKINIAGKIYEKIIIIKFNNNQATVAVDGTQERVDWACLLKCAGSAAFSCISCGTNWTCWATCAGPQVVSCVMGCF